MLLLLLVAGPAHAQADLPDAGLPGVVVDQSGDDRASEEQDNSASSPCLTARDCDRGFACVNARCTWRRYREATYEGCGAMTSTGVCLLAALLLLRRRYFLSNFTK